MSWNDSTGSETSTSTGNGSLQDMIAAAVARRAQNVATHNQDLFANREYEYQEAIMESGTDEAPQYTEPVPIARHRTLRTTPSIHQYDALDGYDLPHVAAEHMVARTARQERSGIPIPPGRTGPIQVNSDEALPAYDNVTAPAPQPPSLVEAPSYTSVRARSPPGHLSSVHFRDVNKPKSRRILICFAVLIVLLIAFSIIAALAGLGLIGSEQNSNASTSASTGNSPEEAAVGAVLQATTEAREGQAFTCHRSLGYSSKPLHPHDGCLVMSHQMTPLSANSFLSFTFSISWGGTGAGERYVVALFDGDEQLYATVVDEGNHNDMVTSTFIVSVPAESVKERTYNIRAGGCNQHHPMFINRAKEFVPFGGGISTLRVTEIAGESSV